MGEYVMGERDWRGDCFLSLPYAFIMHLSHTYVTGFDTRYTCVNNGCSDPKQIVYMATTAPRRYIVQATIAETTATTPDNWPLSLGLLPRSRTRGEQPGGQKTFSSQLDGS